MSGYFCPAMVAIVAEREPARHAISAGRHTLSANLPVAETDSQPPRSSPRWVDDRLTHPSRPRRPAVDAAAPPADHRPRGGGRRPDRQPDHGPAAPALGPR